FLHSLRIIVILNGCSLAADYAEEARPDLVLSCLGSMAERAFLELRLAGVNIGGSAGARGGGLQRQNQNKKQSNKTHSCYHNIPFLTLVDPDPLERAPRNPSALVERNGNAVSISTCRNKRGLAGRQANRGRRSWKLSLLSLSKPENR